MQWCGGACTPSRFPHGQTRGLGPVLPFHVDEAARHRAMPGQPNRDGDISQLPIAAGDVAHAVRRIREAMQQDDGADGLPAGLEYERAVPVLRERSRIDGTSLEVAVRGNPFVWLELPRDVISHLVEECVLGLQIRGPIEPSELVALQLVWTVGMPRLELGATLRIPGADGQQRERARCQHQHHAPRDASQHGYADPSFFALRAVHGGPAGGRELRGSAGLDAEPGRSPSPARIRSTSCRPASITEM